MEKKLLQIGNRIRELRIKKGWESYEVFSYDIGLPRKTVWRLEKGYNFNMLTLIKVLEGLGVSMEEFFKGL